MTKAAATGAQEKLAYRPKDLPPITGLGMTSIYAKMKTGELPCRKCGSATIILAADLKAFMDSLPSGR